VRKSSKKGKRKMSATLTPEILRAVRAAAAVWGHKGGKVKSPARAKASRENGKLGGRPKKTAA
jgi:hypothetical protein